MTIKKVGWMLKNELYDGTYYKAIFFRIKRTALIYRREENIVKVEIRVIEEGGK